MNLYLDIETLPTDNQEVIEEMKKTITAPGQYKKPESIAEWLAANLETELKDKVAKTSFDGLYGRIACIAWAFDDEDVQIVDDTGGEARMLEAFYDELREIAKVVYHGGEASKGFTIIGHNVAGFDLPFIKHRSIIHGIKPQIDIRKAMSAKPWDSCIADTMLMWSSDSQKRVSMDKLCKAFGLDGKGDFDGSMVADTWPTDPQKVIDYCKDDVIRTRAIYKRMIFA